jgi:cytochrome P450
MDSLQDQVGSRFRKQTLILILVVKEWKKHRKVISLTFNQHTLNSFVEIFVLYSNTFAKTLEEYVGHGCFDIFPVMSVSVLDIVCRKSIGTNFVKPFQFFLRHSDGY